MITDDELLRYVEPQLARHIVGKFADRGACDATACFSELLKFLYLTSKYTQLHGAFIPVTKTVDEFWHEAILQTRQYDLLCRKLPGGRFIHHESLPFEAYRTKKSKDALVTEVLLWVKLYVDEFGDFQADRIKFWFFVSKAMVALDLNLAELNGYAKRAA